MDREVEKRKDRDQGAVLGAGARQDPGEPEAERDDAPPRGKTRPEGRSGEREHEPARLDAHATGVTEEPEGEAHGRPQPLSETRSEVAGTHGWDAAHHEESPEERLNRRTEEGGRGYRGPGGRPSPGGTGRASDTSGKHTNQ